MTREEAIKKMQEVKAYMTSGNPIWDITEIGEAFNMAIQALEEPQWIPCSERMPEDDVYVLLTVRRMDDSYNHVPFISTGYISWNHQCWWCAHDGNCKDANIDVLAWMPLPEPWKDGE